MLSGCGLSSARGHGSRSIPSCIPLPAQFLSARVGVSKGLLRLWDLIRKTNNVPSLKMTENLLRPSRDGWYQQHLIAILKCIIRSAEKADVLFVDIDIEEAPNLSGFVAQMRLKIGKLLIERGEQFIQVRRRTFHLCLARG